MTKLYAEKHVLQVYISNRREDVAYCESEAWAEIIANAVNTQEELVAALEDLRDAVHSGGFPHEAIKRADAALSKARGEA